MVENRNGWVSHVIILTSVVLLMCISRVLLKDWHGQELHEVAKRATVQRAQEIETGWKSLTYFVMSQEGFHDAFLRRLESVPLNLSEVQMRRLKSRVPEVLQYLQSPSLSNYYRLKTARLSYYFELTQEAKYFLSNSAPTQQIGDAKELTSLVWNKLHQSNGPAPRRLTAVCLDRVRGTRSTANSMVSLLKGPVANGFTVAEEAVDPGFRYMGTPAATEGLFFDCSFVAKSNADDAGPVYISLRWLDKDQDWALNRLVTDAWLRIRTMF